MPYRCVVGGCPNVPDPQMQISLHKIPFEDNKAPEARRRRRQWLQFVRTKRAKWSPTTNSRVCSEHFRPEDFVRRPLDVPSTIAFVPRLISDEVGVVPVPSIHQPAKDSSSVSRSSSDLREARKIVREIMKTESKPSCSSTTGDGDESICGSAIPVQDAENAVPDESLEQVGLQIQHVSTQTPASCLECKRRSNENRKLRNKIVDMKAKKERDLLLIRKMEKDMESISTKLREQENFQNEESVQRSDDQEEMYIEDAEPEEPDFGSGDDSSATEYEAETGTDESDSEEGDNFEDVDKRTWSDNLREQPKYIVFLSKLLLLFNICHVCKTDHPVVSTKKTGTMVEIETICKNKACPKPVQIWSSQPQMPGTRMAAGNFLLCFGILLSGSIASKVVQLFKHMGLSCFSLRTYFAHQRGKLFPAVYLFWKNYQERMFQQLKETGENIVIAGDGRHDSMGHSAKYCAYSIFACTISSIITFSLIQRNVAGSSPAMEYLGFQECMNYLLGCGLAIGTVITDRHTSIAKHMRERLANITHYFDLWHLKKKIRKVLTKISKNSGCSAILDWIKPCENHLFWSATTTLSGNGEVIWAKFKSFLYHVTNRHKDLPIPLFNKCAHDDNIQDRKWLEEDTVVFEKLKAGLTKKSLVKGIKKISPLEQTSSLEGFHSVLNHYSPKMIAFSYSGMFCRHIIATTHFNYNLHRETLKREDGTDQVKIVYPKFKNGEASVQNVRVKPNYDYVEEIYNTFLVEQKNRTLALAVEELVTMAPQPMNTMLEKQPKNEAIMKRIQRKSMVVQDVPPTAAVPQQVAPAAQERTERQQPHCRLCKEPMKGHKNVVQCPKNQK